MIRLKMQVFNYLQKQFYMTLKNQLKVLSLKKSLGQHQQMDTNGMIVVHLHQEAMVQLQQLKFLQLEMFL